MTYKIKIFYLNRKMNQKTMEAMMISTEAFKVPLPSASGDKNKHHICVTTNPENVQTIEMEQRVMRTLSRLSHFAATSPSSKCPVGDI